MAMIPRNMDPENGNSYELPRMTRVPNVEAANMIETLAWFYPGTNRNIAECVLKQHNIDGSYIMIKERVSGLYEFYDLCVWNVGTPSHFQIVYRKDIDEIEFGLKKYTWFTFRDRFQHPYRVIRSDKDVIQLEYPLPKNVREPSGMWDPILTQDVGLVSDPNLEIRRVFSHPNLLSDDGSYSCSLGVKGGYLVKRGHLRKNWLRRWFVLDKQKLSYYESKPHLVDNPNPKMKGVIDLTEVLRFVAEDHSVKQLFCFAIILSKKTYSISAESESDYRSWVEALKTAMDRYHDAIRRTLPMSYI